MKIKVMKITLSVNSKQSIEVGHSDLASIVHSLDDEPRHSAFFSALASHPASEVRCAVAGKLCLPVQLLKELASDSSINVVRQVANNETALNLFDLDLLVKILYRDVNVASDLADNLYMVSEKSLPDIIVCLMHHSDPQVVDTATSFDANRQVD